MGLLPQPGENAAARGDWLDNLLAFPTVKPVASVADAVLDCTKRGDIRACRISPRNHPN